MPGAPACPAKQPGRGNGDHANLIKKDWLPWSPFVLSVLIPSRGGSRTRSACRSGFRPTQGRGNSRRHARPLAERGRPSRQRAGSRWCFAGARSTQASFVPFHRTHLWRRRQSGAEGRHGCGQDRSAILESCNWTHPFDDEGRRCPYDEMPATVNDLIDDPFRSLAGELKRAGGYAKNRAPFS
jgi:hypothetical protein